MAKSDRYGPVRSALERALTGIEPKPCDLGLIALARRYAHEIDTIPDPRLAATYGERLERALHSLLMTPSARSAVRASATRPPEDGTDALSRLVRGDVDRIDLSAIVDPSAL